MDRDLLFIIFLIFLTSLFDTISQIYLKQAINSLSLHVDSLKKIVILLWRIAKIPTIWISFLCSWISFFFWVFVLSKAELSFAFSVDSFHYVLVAVASAVFLKEKVGLWRWVGTMLIMIGIVLVSMTGGV